MSSLAIRVAANIYLAAAALTSLPVSAGLLGWCPCGCMPEAFVYQQFTDDGRPYLPVEGDDHESGSHRCQGCHPSPCCLVPSETPSTGLVENGSVAVESADGFLPPHVARLIRPPRA